MKALTIPSVTAELVREGVQTIVSWPEQVDGGPVMIVAHDWGRWTSKPDTPTDAVVATATLDCVPVRTEVTWGFDSFVLVDSLHHTAWWLPADEDDPDFGGLDVSDQLDFLDLDAPFALVLSDVKPVGPITDMPCPGSDEFECRNGYWFRREPKYEGTSYWPCTGECAPHTGMGKHGRVPIPSHSGLWEPPQALIALVEGETP